MTVTPAETANLDRYGDDALEWDRAVAAMGDPTPEITYFLGTCRPDGTPHAAGIGAQYLDGVLYFTSSPDARKARDLAVNSAPSAGPPPWHAYRFIFHTAVGVATAEPNGATRWRFTR